MAGKYSAPKKSHWAPFVVILAVAALVATIGGSMAWLTDSQGGLTNTFTPATVSGQIVEDFSDPTVKKDVGVKNTSDVPVYVRVALVPTWVTPRLDETGAVVKENNETVYDVVAHPASLSDLDIKFDSSKWVLGKDGYYYYTEKVPAGDTTEVLIKSAIVRDNATGALAGYHMNLQVLTQAVQADGVDGDEKPAVQNAWGAVIVTAVDSTTGVLTIAK